MIFKNWKTVKVKNLKFAVLWTAIEKNTCYLYNLLWQQDLPIVNDLISNT